MANVLVEESSLQDIADAIRMKNGTQNTYKPGQMGSAIEAIPTGATPTGTKQITITENGTTTEDVSAYANTEITVNVSGGGGSGGLSLIDTISVSGTRSARVDISSSWFSTYDLVLIVHELTFSSSDWLYLGIDADTGTKYIAPAAAVSSVDERYSILLSKPIQQKYRGVWLNSSSPSIAVETYLYFYMYTSSKTMTGSIKIYGIPL